MSDSGEPAQRRVRIEPNIPVNFSNLPAVKEMITENNLQKKLRRRLKPFEFINEVFTKLGDRAINDSNSIYILYDFLKECIEKHDTLPRSSAIAKVLYLWSEKGLVEEGQVLLKNIIQTELVLRKNVFDEKVATVSLRLLTRSSDVDLKFTQKIITMLPEGSHKRRLFFPLLEHAAKTGNISLAFNIFHLAKSKNIEFWDIDYNQILQCLEKINVDDNILSLVDELLECMMDHHPVIGKSNGEILQRIMGGEMSSVNEKTGECSYCKEKLNTFDFTPNDRDKLLNDIETKLVAIRVEGTSRYEPEKIITSTEKEKRWREFEDFKLKLLDLDYDAVIDGANVGYYGLSSWYREAKETLLRSRGIDPTTVPEYQLCDIPLPVDVPLKFSLIDEMLLQTKRLGKKPLIMLHNRHFESLSKENAMWFSKWQKDSSLIACPGFLNDDYCWLYAAIRKPNCIFVSNDQMRDHHFMLLSRRSFLRWRQRHRVTYKALFQKCTGEITLVLTSPRPYAVWVQRGGLTQSHWHIPVLTTVNIIDQATNKISEKGVEVEMDKDGDDSCDAWLCTASKDLINRGE